MLLYSPLPGIMTTARPDGACLIAATTAKTHSAEILRFPRKERAQGRIIADLIGQIPIPGPLRVRGKRFYSALSLAIVVGSNTSPQTWVIEGLLRPCAGQRRHRILSFSTAIQVISGKALHDAKAKCPSRNKGRPPCPRPATARGVQLRPLPFRCFRKRKVPIEWQ